MGTSVPDGQGLLGYDFPAGIEQFHIERLAERGGEVPFPDDHVALEPDVVALVIAGVVEVYVYLCLGERPSELLCRSRVAQ